MTARTLFVKRLLALSLFLLLAGGLLWLGVETLGPHLGTTGLAIAALVLAALGARSVLVVRRRQRQKLEEMRDSALW